MIAGSSSLLRQLATDQRSLGKSMKALSEQVKKMKPAAVQGDARVHVKDVVIGMVTRSESGRKQAGGSTSRLTG